jgi:hypothetical protein
MLFQQSEQPEKFDCFCLLESCFIGNSLRQAFAKQEWAVVT